MAHEGLRKPTLRSMSMTPGVSEPEAWCPLSLYKFDEPHSGNFGGRTVSVFFLFLFLSFRPVVVRVK